MYKKEKDLQQNSTIKEQMHHLKKYRLKEESKTTKLFIKIKSQIIINNNQKS
jgi:hypothetical protein